MSQALYRKWRPARFDQVVGQEHVTRTLKNAVAADRIGHAYLFSGPRGTGKTTLARLLAKAANCLHEDLSQRPCNVCPPCVAVNEARFLDLIEIDAASNTGVDDIRDLREKINFAPSEGRFKIYIIDEVHMLSTAAFNALLKTLEEPPGHVIFVLATTEEHKVPLTIRSRCQLFSFRLLTLQEITGRLRWLAEQEQLTIEPEALIMIAEHGNGSLRDAESLLDQLVAAPGDTVSLERAQMVLGTATSEAVFALIDAWLRGDGAAGLSVIHDALATGADARQFSRQVVSHLRTLLLIRTAGQELPLGTTADQQARMSQQAISANRQRLIEAVRRFNEASAARSVGWLPQLPLELAFVESLSLEESAEDVVEAAEPRSTAMAAPAPAETTVVPSTQQTEAVSEDSKPGPATGAGVEESDTQPAPEPATLSLELVKTKWPELRERTGRRDKNVPALLASCKPLAMEGNVLVLGFDFQILKEKFDNRESAKSLVAEELSELLGVPCHVRTIVTDQYIPPAAATEIGDEEFAALAQELGGVVRDG